MVQGDTLSMVGVCHGCVVSIDVVLSPWSLGVNTLGVNQVDIVGSYSGKLFEEINN